jgi:citrate synthase
MFNAILVTLVEHGITPSAIVARMTYLGAPEAMQAAVAAGLCGLGTVFVGSMEGAARMLYETMPSAAPRDLAEAARAVVAAFRERREIIPGLGHPVHKPIDPRTIRLFALAEECGFAGDYVALMRAIGAEAEKASGKSLPINATGAIGAICCELGFKWQVIRGFGVMARAIGLVGHLMEEAEHPMATEIWLRTEEEASAHLRGEE